jgi:hypothetical protein
LIGGKFFSAIADFKKGKNIALAASKQGQYSKQTNIKNLYSKFLLKKFISLKIHTLHYKI